MRIFNYFSPVVVNMSESVSEEESDFSRAIFDCRVVHNDILFFRKLMLLDESGWGDFTSTRSILESSAAAVELCVAILEMYPNDDAWKQEHPLLRFHAPAMLPVEVKTSDSLQAMISKLFMKPSVYMMSTSLWLAGFIALQVTVFDASESWWVVVFAAGMVPESVFTVASLHSKTFWKLLRNFQTIFVSFYGIAMTLALCVLWRRHPLKIASVLITSSPILARRWVSGCFS